jgi:dienelactone hydrolase
MVEPISFKNNQGVELSGDLFIPKGEGLFPCVVFAHGLYSNHKSPRNREIAFALIEKGIVALLFDFSEREVFADETWVRHADDLKCALDFLETQPEIEKQRIGVNGSSTGATAALRLAAEDPRIKTIVVRSARVINIWDRVEKIKVPILIIVGGADEVKDESEELYRVLKSEKRFEEIAGAGHLFEEGETFKDLSKLTVGWYDKNLKS